MDRHSFLSSFPYLVPVPLSGWPPRRSIGIGGVAGDNKITFRHETHLSQSRYGVSLEAIDTSTAFDQSNNNNSNTTFQQSLGPISFVPRSEHDGSPQNNSNCSSSSVCPAELCLEFKQTPAVAPSFLQAHQPTVSQLEQQQQQNRPQPSTMFQYSTSPIRGISHAGRSMVTERCSAIYWRINGKTYALDWRKLQRLTLHPAATIELGSKNKKKTKKQGVRFGVPGEDDDIILLQHDNNDDGDDDEAERFGVVETAAPTAKTKKVPPCLILRFPSLLIRVFPFATASSLAVSAFGDDDAEDASTLFELQKVQQRLSQVYSQVCKFDPAMLPPEQSHSPASTTTASHSHSGSSSHQQHQHSPALREMLLETDKEGAAGNNNNNNPNHRYEDSPASDAKPPAKQPSPSERKEQRADKFKKRKVAFEQCRSTIMCIRNVLESRVSSLGFMSTSSVDVPSSNTAGGSHANIPVLRDLRGRLANLCTAAADQLSESYAHPSHIKHEWNKQKRQQDNQLQAFVDPVLEQYFPSGRARKRAQLRQRQRGGGAAPPLPPQPMVDPEQCIDKVHQALKHYQQETVRRHSLLALPQRGKAKRQGRKRK